MEKKCISNYSKLLNILLNVFYKKITLQIAKYSDIMFGMIRQELKKILREKGKTNYQLWKELKINQGQLSSFFKGKRGMSLKKLEQIVDHLDYEILLLKKREIGRTLHKEKVVEEAKIAEKKIEQIIEAFETNCDVYVRDITVGNDKVKITYGQGEYPPTEERKKPESEQESKKPLKYRPWDSHRDLT